MCENVGSHAVGILLDTFHMGIEEKSQGAAIRRAGKHLKHFHACENDRGTPGTGQVPWKEVREALLDIGYDGIVAIEGFNPEIVDLANGACIWRPMAPTPDRLAGDGVQFLKKLFG
jgi:D-psicose/D-tagatose/L-ribulose 3-epimerase